MPASARRRRSLSFRKLAGGANIRKRYQYTNTHQGTVRRMGSSGLSRICTAELRWPDGMFKASNFLLFSDEIL